MITKKELPDVGELVVATVREVYDYGAYLNLDDYGGLEAYLPWSEVTSRWVRSIHDVVKPGHKIVVKVIRVNRKRKQIDVSLKRVTNSERKRKMIEWKRLHKAYKILEIVAQKIGVSFDKIYSEVGEILEKEYGELMAGLEEIAIRGEDVLRELQIPENYHGVLLNEVKRHVEIRRVKISGTLTLRSKHGDGVNRIIEVLRSMRDAVNKFSEHNVKLNIYLIGSPRYRIEIEGYDYKSLESVLEEALTRGKDLSEKLGVEFVFSREKR